MKRLAALMLAVTIISSMTISESAAANGRSRSGSKFIHRIGKKQMLLRSMAQNKDKLQKASLRMKKGYSREMEVREI